MTQKFKYQLRKGSKKEICPNCRKRTFTPYVLASDGKTVADASKYGYCDRINSCKYVLYPEGENMSDWIAPEPQPKPYIAPNPDFIPKEMVKKSFAQFDKNPFFLYLSKLFDIDTANMLQKKYNIGTASNYGTIFFQADKNMNFRTGKVMFYNKFGNRRKDKKSFYLHKKIKKDYSLHQVLFGEHLITDEKPIALVESEKSCIILSVFYPEYNWVASGGVHMLNIYRLSRLPRLDKVYPDQGAFDLWERNTKSMFMNRQMSVRVEQAFKKGILQKGDDLLDLELIERGLNNVHI